MRFTPAQEAAIQAGNRELLVSAAAENRPCWWSASCA